MADKYSSLQIEDISKNIKAPLSRYPGPDDFRYMKLRAQIGTFLREFRFFHAVNHSLYQNLADILAQERLDTNKPRFLGDTALHIATNKGFRGIVQTLLSYAADMSLPNTHGKTALQIAVENLDEDMVQLLLGKGARRDAKCNNGKPLSDLLNSRAVEESDNSRKEKIQKILKLLRNPPLLEGPSTVAHPELSTIPQQATFQDGPQPAPLPYGAKACKNFHFTIANFFHTPEDGKEYFDIRTATVHDVLYTTSPDVIIEPVLAQAEAKAKDLGKTRFSWYHVPANNVSPWV